MANKKMRWFDWVLTLLVALVLVGVGIGSWTNFDLLSTITFQMAWLYKTVATIVAVIGLGALIRLIMKVLK